MFIRCDHSSWRVHGSRDGDRVGEWMISYYRTNTSRQVYLDPSLAITGTIPIAGPQVATPARRKLTHEKRDMNPFTSVARKVGRWEVGIGPPCESNIREVLCQHSFSSNRCRVKGHVKCVDGSSNI